MLTIIGYQLNEELYNGSRTLVYRGYREVDHKPVVIKLLKNPYPCFRELVQFRNQYTIGKDIHQPGIIETYSLESYQNGYALVMEDFSGISLKDYFTSEKPRYLGSLEEFLQIAIALCDSLDTLYHKRIIHKDIKPSNILINPETKQIKLIDFSIASWLPRETQTLINSHILEGTLAYISPEQTGRMNRFIDYRTDFYSLGVTFYELLTGELPFQSNDAMELVHCHIAKIPTALGNRKQSWENREEIPQVLSDIVMKLMAKNAEDRYQSALGLKYDLENCLTQLQETGAVKSFPIAQRDVCDRFIIPEKLYGREQEVQTLLTAFDRVANGAAEIMLVAGFSGIGKTAVVNEIHKPIVKQHGYFIKGKFDQFNRNIPFSAFVQAFRDLMGQLLTESDQQIQKWQHKITEALGDHGQVIVEVVPELELIIGKQPPAPELSGSAAQNRFNLLFQKFVKLFTTQEHPLVMFLDDLQWIDSASLKLIHSLMSEINSGYLLLIGAYRDNEVSGAHHLIVTLDEIKKNGVKLNTITLQPLNNSKLNQLVAETLNCTETLAFPLSKLIYQKTQGNPFFATQFIKVLHQDGLIYFNYERGYWQCNIAEINQRSLTNDVVEFMALQLQKLPESTLGVLKLAACIGNQFDLETLAIVSQQSTVETAACLWSALQEGFILPQSEVYKFFVGAEPQKLTQDNSNSEIIVYKFLHDRIQQAAYSLIPQTQKQNFHYQIGQLLLQKTLPEAREERIFELVNQLNYGLTLITEQTQLDEVAQLNLIACRKARSATAYQAVHEYAKIGLQFVGEAAWLRQYQLTLNFHELAAEAASLSGDFEQMNTWIDAVIDHAQNSLERVQVYHVKIQALASQNQLLEAIATGLSVLKLLGIDLPDNPSPADMQQAMQELNELLAQYCIEDLINLPQMLDEQKLAVMKIASSICPSCTMTGSIPLLVLLTVLQVKLSVKFGNSPISAVSYVNYAILLTNMVQDVEKAAQFGRLAYQLALEPEYKNVFASVCSAIVLFIHHRTAHLEETIAIAQQGYQIGLETGDLQYAGYNRNVVCFHAYWSGQPLAELEPQIRLCHQQLLDINQLGTANFVLTYSEAIVILMGNPENQELRFLEADYERQLLSDCLATKDIYRLSLFYLQKFILRFWLGDISGAVQDANQARQFLQPSTGIISEALFYFYNSLTILATNPQGTAEAEIKLQQVQENQAKLQQWIHHAPMNYLHKYYLVEAERHRILGHKLEAIEYYNSAATLAKTHKYLQDAALANELTAKFYLELDQETAAQGYMQEAYYCYARWGAKVKTDDLEKCYPQLLKPILQQRRLNFNSLETIATIGQISTNNSTSIADVLNFSSILKAAQTISSTIKLDELLASLTKIILENSGAKKSALILPDVGGTWQVKAITWLNHPANSLDDIQTRINPQPIDTCQDIPTTIINYVKNTQKTIVIDNCKTDIPGIIGEYMHRIEPKSILCTPIIHQGYLVGILYLENQLTSGVFNSDRLEVIQILSAQAAISLENARLYRESQEKAQQLQQSLQQQKTLFKVVTQIRKSLDLDEIFRAVTQNIRQILNADRVGIYQFHLNENYEYGEFIAEDVLPQFTSALAVKVQDHCFGENFATLYKQGRICAITDVNTDAVKDCHRAILAQFQVRASLVVPIMQDEELWGLLCIHQCDHPRDWLPFEIQFAQQIGAQMGVALQQTDLLIKTQKQATQLEQTLQHLQQTQLQLVQHEKMSALGNLVAGVAHEMNNPLGFIAASLEQAQPTLTDIIEHIHLYQSSSNYPDKNILNHAKQIDLDYSLQDLPKMITSMILACDRLKNISTSLRTFSRADKDYKVDFNIHEGIDSTILILKHRLKANNQRPAIAVITEYGILPKIECFPGQLNQVFMNILANAIDALDESNIGRRFKEIETKPNQIKITTSVEDSQVKIAIADNGKGMNEEVKQKIFDHLFTTKEVSKGTGLGLAIARQIVVEKHGGTIDVNSQPGEGTEFVIMLPINEED